MKKTEPQKTTSWAPLGRALHDYHHGADSAQIIIRSDLWEDELTPVAEYYRPFHQDLPEIEALALKQCRGRVLDLGAGAGRHALELQERGLQVTALDIAEEAVEVMQIRGVTDARRGDITTVAGEKFDTILMLMHGIGLVGNLCGLAQFLDLIPGYLADGGRIICDSADLESIIGPRQEEYLEKTMKEGDYLGEVSFVLSYNGLEGAPYPWVFVDPQTLAGYAETAGLTCKILFRANRGAYLARISHRKDYSEIDGMLRARTRS